MRELRRPALADVEALLEASALPTSDVDDELLRGFVGIHEEDRLISVGGLENHGKVALLRSIATLPPLRGTGLARNVVSALEAKALADGVTDVYLLTETAEPFFTKLGYTRVERAAAPRAIAQTAQFRELCPDDAAFMHKRVHLS